LFVQPFNYFVAMKAHFFFIVSLFGLSLGLLGLPMSAIAANGPSLALASWNDGYQQAKDERRLLMTLVISTDNAPAMRRFQETALAHAEVQKALAAGYVVAQLDLRSKAADCLHKGRKWTAHDLVVELASQTPGSAAALLFVAPWQNDKAEMYGGYETPKSLVGLLGRMTRDYKPRRSPPPTPEAAAIAAVPLTGRWQCTDGAVYYIRDDATGLSWYAEQAGADGRITRAYGQREGDKVHFVWVDDRGRAAGRGEVTLKQLDKEHLVVESHTGDAAFASVEWKRLSAGPAKTK
jgi:hypothetical protein